MRWCTLIFCFAAGVLAADTSAGQAIPEPIAWRQNVFSIPFRVSADPQHGGGPVEVQLYVSADAGSTWHLAERAKPQQGQFVFRAPQDGDYWFAIRTLDAAGVESPAGPHRPGLRVLVDTLAPRLDLSGRAGESGEIFLRWHAADPNLRADSLKIEYQLDPQGPWLPLAISQEGREAPPGERSGRATWWPGPNHGVVAFRAEVFDSAGNRAIRQTKVVHQPHRDPSQPQAWPPDQLSRVPLSQHLRP